MQSAANFSLLLQLLLQQNHQTRPQSDDFPITTRNQLYSKSNFAPNQISSKPSNFLPIIEDGCYLNMFEDDTCANGTTKVINDKSIIAKKRNYLKCRKWLWPDRSIPYRLSITEPLILERFLEAVDAVNELQCVTFYELDPSEIDTRRKFLHVRQLDHPAPGRSCQATLGSLGRHPRLDLSHLCTRGQILHELMHVLGFAHEHQRPDRDRFVRIRCDRVMTNVTEDFRRMKTESIGEDLHEDPYDFTSIMHYRLDHFSVVNGRRTIEPTEMGLERMRSTGVDVEEIGAMKRLSDPDVRRIRRLYKCEKGGDPPKLS